MDGSREIGRSQADLTDHVRKASHESHDTVIVMEKVLALNLKKQETQLHWHEQLIGLLSRMYK